MEAVNTLKDFNVNLFSLVEKIYDFDFEIDSNAATGGYLLEFVLKGYDSYDPATDSFGAEIASSDTILIAFNNGMDEHDFEDGVSAIPVPAAAWLFISAISSLIIGRRLKK